MVCLGGCLPKGLPPVQDATGGLDTRGLSTHHHSAVTLKQEAAQKACAQLQLEVTR